MSKHPVIYSAFETEAALCVWEWLLEVSANNKPPNYETIAALFSNYGSGGMRMSAMQAGIIVVECYSLVEKDPALEHMTDDSFDWEFVPMICRHLDWEKLVDNNQYGNGDWRPDPKELLAIIIAKRALNVAA